MSALSLDHDEFPQLRRLEYSSDTRSHSIRLFKYHEIVEAGTAHLNDPDFSSCKGSDSLMQLSEALSSADL